MEFNVIASFIKISIPSAVFVEWSLITWSKYVYGKIPWLITINTGWYQDPISKGF